MSVLCPADYQSDTDITDVASEAVPQKRPSSRWEVGSKRVVEARKDEELYIFTHPNYRPLMQQQSAAIDAAFERAAQSPLLQYIVAQKLNMLYVTMTMTMTMTMNLK